MTFLDILLLLLIAAAAGYVASVIVATLCTFLITFVRTKPTKWTTTEDDKSPEKQAMYAFGRTWREEHADKMREVFVTNGGLRLHGEYYDFGFDKAVIVLLGRSENTLAGFYYVDPYVRCGYNVLITDNRAHGKSEGKFVTFGYEESKDMLAWADLLHTRFGNRKCVLHGVCVGASAGVYALVREDCPDYIEGLVSEGMHTRLYETVKNHIIERKKPVFPVIYTVNWLLLLFTHHSMMRGPIDVIDRYTKPILFLQGKEDLFSRPEKTSVMFEKCTSADKTVCYFDKGPHSLLKYYNPEQYDGAVTRFLQELNEK